MNSKESREQSVDYVFFFLQQTSRHRGITLNINTFFFFFFHNITDERFSLKWKVGPLLPSKECLPTDSNLKAE